MFQERHGSIKGAENKIVSGKVSAHFQILLRLMGRFKNKHFNKASSNGLQILLAAFLLFQNFVRLTGFADLQPGPAKIGGNDVPKKSFVGTVKDKDSSHHDRLAMDFGHCIFGPGQRLDLEKKIFLI